MDLDFVAARVREISKSIAEKGGFEFVRSEIVGTKRNPLVRIYIDRPDGLTVEHCAEVSREIDARLEAEDLIPTKYVLEVSSPGLERELFSLDDFRKFTGRLVKVKTAIEIDGNKTFVGKIVEAEDDSFTLQIRSDHEITIPFSSVSRANLKIDLNEEFRRRR